MILALALAMFYTFAVVVDWSHIAPKYVSFIRVGYSCDPSL